MTTTTAIFHEALQVWNQALEKHGEKMPYKQLIAACEKMLGDRKMDVEVFDVDTGVPIERFAVRMQNRQLEPVDEAPVGGEPTWRVSTAYLQKVVRDADEYIEHPTRLDWDWIKDRVGMRL